MDIHKDKQEQNKIHLKCILDYIYDLAQIKSVNKICFFFLYIDLLCTNGLQNGQVSL